METTEEIQNSQIRRNRIIFLGIALILGVLLPVFTPDSNNGATYKFINFAVMNESQIPVAVRFMAIWPFLAGLSIIIFSILTKRVERTAGIFAAWLVPLLIVVFSSSARDWIITTGFSEGNKLMGEPIINYGFFVGGISLVGLIVTFISSRLLFYRRKSILGPIIGLTAAPIVFIQYILPIFPEEFGVAPAFTLIKNVTDLSSVSEGAYTLLSLLVIVCFIVGSIICFITFWNRDKARSYGRIAFILICIPFILPVFYLFIALAQLEGRLVGKDVIAILLMTVKSVCLVWGCILVIPVGFADLAIYLTGLSTATSGTKIASDIDDKLNSLKQLQEEGLITEVEYEQKKNEILSDL